MDGFGKYLDNIGGHYIYLQSENTSLLESINIPKDVYQKNMELWGLLSGYDGSFINWKVFLQFQGYRLYDICKRESFLSLMKKDCPQGLSAAVKSGEILFSIDPMNKGLVLLLCPTSSGLGLLPTIANQLELISTSNQKIESLKANFKMRVREFFHCLNEEYAEYLQMTIDNEAMEASCKLSLLLYVNRYEDAIDFILEEHNYPYFQTVSTKDFLEEMRNNKALIRAVFTGGLLVGNHHDFEELSITAAQNSSHNYVHSFVN